MMRYLTQQQRTVITVVVGLLLTGWAVKAWRLSHELVTPSSVRSGQGS